jgi:DNA-directed RNA polymerase alpha subunit
MDVSLTQIANINERLSDIARELNALMVYSKALQKSISDKISPNYQTSVDDLELTVRTANSLNRQDLKTIYDIVNFCQKQPLYLSNPLKACLPNFGNVSYNELKRALMQKGVDIEAIIKDRG